jgi:hypothetical protein
MTSSLCRWMILGASLSTLVAHAAQYSLVIDPEQSSITASGNAAGFAISEQGTGSLTTRLAGTLLVDVSGNNISFLPGSSVDAEANGEWQPLPGGATGAAPADFAGQASVVLTTIKAAFRDIIFQVSGSDIPLTGGSFDASQLVFSFSADSQSHFDYDAGFFGQDSKSLAGVESSSNQGTGTVTGGEGSPVVMVPLKGSFSFEILEPDDSELILTGQIVAKAVALPELTSIVVENGALTISFTSTAGAESELQFSHDLKNWAPVTSGVQTTSPGHYTYTAATEGDFTFFRVVRK